MADISKFAPTGPTGPTYNYKDDVARARLLKHQSYYATEVGMFDASGWYTIAKIYPESFFQQEGYGGTRAGINCLIMISNAGFTMADAWAISATIMNNESSATVIDYKKDGSNNNLTKIRFVYDKTEVPATGFAQTIYVQVYRNNTARAASHIGVKMICSSSSAGNTDIEKFKYEAVRMTLNTISDANMYSIGEYELLEISLQPKAMSAAITVDGVSQTTVEGALDAINTLAAGNKTNIGTLSNLKTTAKSNLVSAINEQWSSAHGDVTSGWYTVTEITMLENGDIVGGSNLGFNGIIEMSRAFNSVNNEAYTLIFNCMYEHCTFDVTGICGVNLIKKIRAVYDSAEPHKSYIQVLVDGLTTNYLGVKLILNNSYHESLSYSAVVPTLNTIIDANLVVLGETTLYNNTISDRLDNINAYLGLYNDTDIAGCKHDMVNYTHTRMANAQGKNAGSDFNAFPMYGGSYRCNLNYIGTELARYGDSGYNEDGSNGMCMVYRPKFYYRRVPLKLESLATGYGYLMREWIDYISHYPKPGFKLHPAFIGENGQEINGYYISAYEGCLYDVSANAYIRDDAQVADFSADILCSIANAKPISGTSQQLTRANAEILAKKRGTGWHTLTLPIFSAEQMLFSIEYATFNSQTAIGRGVVDASAPVVTGQTSSLGNASGMASGTDGLVSVSYRGSENEWGNRWKFVEGINVWGDGTMGGGMPYICSDYNFAEEKKTDNYKACGFTLANASGYVSAFGYSEEYDWLYLPVESLGDSNVPIGDVSISQSNCSIYYVPWQSANYQDGTAGGLYNISELSVATDSSSNCSARLVYIPEK